MFIFTTLYLFANILPNKIQMNEAKIDTFLCQGSRVSSLKKLNVTVTDVFCPYLFLSDLRLKN